ncbi:MAG TPA: SRPBCC domain-containing protein [Mycobacterium sp.]|nr:SRPBCC domain-containing protein [Mycobacterium sp.]
MEAKEMLRLERTYPAAPETVWELWTTAGGIEAWWSPDGFRTEVRALELRPGGELVHAMTAESPEMVEFMKSAGMPLTNVSRKVFTEVSPHRRLAYRSVIDFVPDREPYEHLTVVELEPVGDGVKVTMTMEPLHDDVWTERLVSGRSNELDNLGRVIEAQ